MYVRSVNKKDTKREKKIFVKKASADEISKP